MGAINIFITIFRIICINIHIPIIITTPSQKKLKVCVVARATKLPEFQTHYLLNVR